MFSLAFPLFTEHVLTNLVKPYYILNFYSGLLQSGTNSGKATGLSGKICTREVPRLIGLTLALGAQPQRIVVFPKGPFVGKFFQTTLSLFHCLSDFGVQKLKRMQPRACMSEHLF